MSSVGSSTLLKNGTLLIHTSEESPKVIPLFKHDILLEDGFITSIGQKLGAFSTDTKIIDCTDKIISPGFVNTHVHLWQSQLKGRFSNSTLFDYLPRGNWANFVYTPDDIYVGQLAACIEALDGGNTTVLDHCHGCRTTEHAEQALNAINDSGIRAVWAYSEPVRIEKWDEAECTPSYDYWNEKTIMWLEDTAKHWNTERAKIEVGLAFDQWFLPEEVSVPLFKRLTSFGMRTITSHIGRDAVLGLGSPITAIRQNHGLLDPFQSHLGFQNYVASHCMGLKADQLDLLQDIRASGLNMSIACTPTTEAAMCMHQTPAFSPALAGPRGTAVCSLGIDCISSGMSYLPSAGLLLMNMARVNSNEKYLAQEKYPMSMRGSIDEVFNMMTVYGARALGMDDKRGIGRLEVGRKADIVVINTDRPGIGAAARHNPLDALITFSNSGDIEHVFVDGFAVKKDFRSAAIRLSRKETEWKDLRHQVLKSYEGIESRLDGLDMDKATETMIGMFHIDTSRFVSGE